MPVGACRMPADAYGFPPALAGVRRPPQLQMRISLCLPAVASNADLLAAAGRDMPVCRRRGG